MKNTFIIISTWEEMLFLNNICMCSGFNMCMKFIEENVVSVDKLPSAAGTELTHSTQY